MTITTPLSGTVCRQWLGLAMIKLCTKFEISKFAHYERRQKIQKLGWFGG